MKIGIIADDLTGANDSGVQLAKYGLATSVLLERSEEDLNEEIVVFDTDSRAVEANEARKRVKEASQFLVDQEFTFIFKKIDSTMRGNIGQELKGLQSVVHKDFTFIMPGYPNNRRKVHNGDHYVKDIKLHETEIAEDPLMPVKESYLPKLVSEQIDEEVGLITHDEINGDLSHLESKMEDYSKRGVHFVVVDSYEESDFTDILSISKKLNYGISWAGSAGLANYIPEFLGIDSKESVLKINDQNKPVLTVVGSVNINSREQLDYLLTNEEVASIEVRSEKLVSDEETQKSELNRLRDFLAEKSPSIKSLVVYTSGTSNDIKLAREEGKKQGLNSGDVSRKIVEQLGIITSELIENEIIQGLTVTGGDTIKQIAANIGTSGFELHDELQTGVPISNFKGIPDVFCITKAGGFGKENIFVEANQTLRGE